MKPTYKLSDFLMSVIENSYHKGNIWRLDWIGDKNRFYVSTPSKNSAQLCPLNWVLA